MLLALTSDMTSHPLVWLAFVAFVLVAMAIDLGLYQRKGTGHMTTRAALTWVAIWTALALCFNAGVWRWLGPTHAQEFLAGYLLEQSLSIDNLFVFVLVFSHFKTPRAEQHRVLVWGIIGAMVLRAIMILAGSALVKQFESVMLIFAAILLFSGGKLLFKGDEEDDDDPADGWVVRTARRVMPVTDGYRGKDFFVHEADAPGEATRRKATLLFLVLVVIEISDVLFAVDSIPAIFGVTTDPFIVFTSNVFAILGLRSLFFVIEAAIQRLAYLKKGLALVLLFIGLKMVLPFAHHLLEWSRGSALELPELLFDPGWKLKVLPSLGVIVLTLGTTAGLSLFATRRGGPAPGAAGQSSVTITRSDSSARLLAVAGITPDANEPTTDPAPEVDPPQAPRAASGNGEHPPEPVPPEPDAPPKPNPESTS
jgi:tellurite resistance protein TerC